MKTYATKAVAKQQASAKTNKLGLAHFFFGSEDQFTVATEEEIEILMLTNSIQQMFAFTPEGEEIEIALTNAPTEVEAAASIEKIEALVEEVKTARRLKSRPVVAEFLFKGEDAKYFFVEVEARKFKIAKSRATGEVVGDHITICMSAKYAATRPELKLAA